MVKLEIFEPIRAAVDLGARKLVLELERSDAGLVEFDANAPLALEPNDRLQQAVVHLAHLVHIEIGERAERHYGIAQSYLK